MDIPLIDVTDTTGQRLPTVLTIPETEVHTGVIVTFTTPGGPRGSYFLADIIEAAATRPDDGVFIMHDGFDGEQNTSISTHWMRLLARSAMSALPRSAGELVLAVKFLRDDPRYPF